MENLSRVDDTGVWTKVAYLFVLIGRHGDEFRLLENVTPERRIRKFQDVIGSHEVKPRLILVHRVQYRLQKEREHTLGQIVLC